MIYKDSLDKVFEKIKGTREGLTSLEAEKRLKENGYNQLKEKKKITILQLFLENFKDPLVIILLVAAAIQIVSGHLIDSLIILLVLILNAILGVVQTRKAEGSLDALKKLSAPEAKVLRDKLKISIPACDLVVGDIVFLDAGDYIPADGRILVAESLKVMEGILTGESEPILKNVDSIDKEVPLGDRKNMVFSGTMVVYGRGTLLVTNIGMETEIGKIAELMESTEGDMTPLQRNLEKFTHKLGIGILGLSVLIFSVMMFKSYFIAQEKNMWAALLNAFIFAVAVAVAAIPEALSSIVTIVLSVGTNTMAKKNAIIRKLPAVETLGSTGIICTDKTGTLTQNKMTVVDYYMKGIENPKFHEKIAEIPHHEKTFIMASTLANDSSITKEGKEIGDPTEIALINFAIKHKMDIDELREDFQRIGELPFDSDRKIMSSVHKIGSEIYMFSKGAPDVIISRCSEYLENGAVINLDEEIKSVYKDKNEDFSRKALRVLALSYKKIESENFIPTFEDEIDLTLIGLIAMIDPPREEVYSAIIEAKKAGIKPIMITGDHKTTAAAIAVQIGLMVEGEKALTGQELDILTDEELDMDLEKISVYARVSPENKIRIVKAWQRKGKITAMTGDGVNDAPALKQADIGIAMGTGTAVAKDAAAMVLIDDNFVSIVHAIEIGRTVYSNIKKSITYLFTGNLGAIVAILFALFADWDAPFTPLQLLFINLVNDSVPAIALGLEPAEKNIMNMLPRDSRAPLFSKKNYLIILIRGVIIGCVTILAQKIGGVSMSFTTLIFSRILQTLPARSSELTILKLGIFTNKYVWMAIGICFSLYSIVLLPFTRVFFNISQEFGIKEILISLALASTAVLLMEIEKIVKEKIKS
ncbi:MAG: cation-translocating P-type ATPase [Fusobacteriaceae bacterium]